MISIRRRQMTSGKKKYKNIETFQIGMKAMKTIEIAEETYESLLEDSAMLSALRSVGVDSWQGWDEAMDIFRSTLLEIEDE